MGTVRRPSDRNHINTGTSSAGTVSASIVPACTDVSSVKTAISAALTACPRPSSASATRHSRRRYDAANTRSGSRFGRIVRRTGSSRRSQVMPRIAAPPAACRNPTQATPIADGQASRSRAASSDATPTATAVQMPQRVRAISSGARPIARWAVSSAAASSGRPRNFAARAARTGRRLSMARTHDRTSSTAVAVAMRTVSPLAASDCPARATTGAISSRASSAVSPTSMATTVPMAVASARRAPPRSLSTVDVATAGF